MTWTREGRRRRRKRHRHAARTRGLRSDKKWSEVCLGGAFGWERVTEVSLILLPPKFATFGGVFLAPMNANRDKTNPGLNSICEWFLKPARYQFRPCTVACTADGSRARQYHSNSPTEFSLMPKSCHSNQHSTHTCASVGYGFWLSNANEPVSPRGRSGKDGLSCTRTSPPTTQTC